MDRKRKIIGQIDEIKLHGLQWAECGKILNGYICEKETAGIRPMLGNIRYVKDLFRANHYFIRKSGCGKILFLYLANNIKNPHAYTKMQKAADLVRNKVELRTDKRRTFNRYIYKAFLVVVWYMQLSKTDLSRSERMYLAIQLFQAYTEYRVVKRKIEELNLSLVVSIHDVRMEDNILIQFVRTKGIQTLTLCHGAFRLPQDEFDYICSVSDYFVVSDMTMEKDAILMGIEQKKIVKAGRLQYIGRKRRKLDFVENPKQFAVFLNHPIDRKNNYFLLECGQRLAEEYGMKYYVKPHPSDTIKLYADVWKNQNCIGVWTDSDSLEQCVDKVAFGLVGTNSIMFEEIFSYGRWAFRGGRESQMDIFENIKEMKFQSYEELVQEFQKCRNREDLIEIADLIARNTFGDTDVKEQYICFFKRYE